MWSNTVGKFINHVKPKPTYSQNLKPIIVSFSIFLLLYLIFLSFGFDYKTTAQNQNQYQNDTISVPSLTDSKLKVELVASNFTFLTNIEFLGKDDILVLEKNTGNVYRIFNGNVSGPLIHIDVGYDDEQGLLGIAASKPVHGNKNNIPVFLYYTQCNDHDNKSSQECGNYVYRYKFEARNDRFTNRKLILSLPALPGPSHNGGVLAIGKDNNLYITIGDLQPSKFNQNSVFDTRAQNFINGTPPDGRGGILRVTQEGKPVGQGILGHKYPLNSYYAYGIRNSFGIGFDPINGNLWDTENGPSSGDEINLVEHGFNSGWDKVQGIWKFNEKGKKNGLFNESSEASFVDFNGKGKYSKPEFVWDTTVGPTALIFFDSDKLGNEYKNDIFVGSAKNQIFHFDLKENRKALALSGNLTDLVVDKNDNSSKIIFGKNFGTITDLEVGPDGYLYVVSGLRAEDEGSIYKIIPK
jgi:glucose/arabinose dehydrogenase